ncbi:hypothetical protein B0H10DRAFT_2195081 [Mycena sp. CBHHK59/15]|nr:hypothetical protein B0H10DRAFT_2195081 [Mycena sp. CBHHK59/15]
MGEKSAARGKLLVAPTGHVASVGASKSESSLCCYQRHCHAAGTDHILKLRSDHMHPTAEVHAPPAAAEAEAEAAALAALQQRRVGRPRPSHLPALAAALRVQATVQTRIKTTTVSITKPRGLLRSPTRSCKRARKGSAGKTSKIRVAYRFDTNLVFLRSTNTTPQRMGRGIRRVASLFDEVSEIIITGSTYVYQRDNSPEPDDIDESTDNLTEEEKRYLAEKRESERTYEAYLQIQRLVPNLDQRVKESSSEALADFFAALQRGASDGRAEDLRKLSSSMGTWLNQMQAEAAAKASVAQAPRETSSTAASGSAAPHDTSSVPSSVRLKDKAYVHISLIKALKAAQSAGPSIVWFDPQERSNRGLQHDTAGRLLCPIEYDWEDLSIRAKLRSGELHIGSSFYARLFYTNFDGNPDDLEAGFLKSGILVKGFKSCFTSPSSAKDEPVVDENTPQPPPNKKLKTGRRSTRKVVAEILRMSGRVTGRAIAYIAVIEHFALTDAPQWCTEYYGISYPQMYNFIVDFFESPKEGTEAKRRVDDLLAWWNQYVVVLSIIYYHSHFSRKIFPNHASAVTTHASSVSSYEKLRAQRAAKEAN